MHVTEDLMTRNTKQGQSPSSQLCALVPCACPLLPWPVSSYLGSDGINQPSAALPTSTPWPLLLLKPIFFFTPHPKTLFHCFQRAMEGETGTSIGCLLYGPELGIVHTLMGDWTQNISATGGRSNQLSHTSLGHTLASYFAPFWACGSGSPWASIIYSFR